MARPVTQRNCPPNLRRPHNRPGRSPRLASFDWGQAVRIMSENFGQVVVCDFEYETSGGEYQLVAGDLPRPLCVVAYVLDEHLQHVRTVRRWRGDFGMSPPFDIGPD